MSLDEALDKAFGKEEKQPLVETKIVYRNKEVIKSPFNKQELTDIEDLIYNKISNYEINITNYKKRHKITNDNDPRLMKAKNYREKLRYQKILNKIRELIKENV